MTALQVFLLIAAANGAPILARKLLGGRLQRAIDGGVRLADGRPVFGPTKTWRGLLSAVLAAGLVALPLHLPFAFGALLGGLAMLGDLVSSFTKRRLGLAPSSRARGLDQIPESLLPALAAAVQLGMTAVEVLLVVVAFAVLERAASRLLYRLGIRRRPY